MLNRANRVSPATPRSRHVTRSCQMKLWTTASSTATMVAGSHGQCASDVSRASAVSWRGKPSQPTTMNTLNRCARLNTKDAKDTKKYSSRDPGYESLASVSFVSFVLIRRSKKVEARRDKGRVG